MWRSLGIMLAGLVMLVGFVIGALVLEARAADFEERGTRVPGVVTGVHGGHRQSWTADVRYRVGDVDRTRSVQMESDPSFIAGDPITVIYDLTATDTRVHSGRESHDSARLAVCVPADMTA